jgi:hypothetical protein
VAYGLALGVISMLLTHGGGPAAARTHSVLRGERRTVRRVYAVGFGRSSPFVGAARHALAPALHARA